jgi:superfamily II DNA/RNA helicase
MLLPFMVVQAFRINYAVIKRGVQIVVATPGRMLDIINRKAIRFFAG